MTGGELIVRGSVGRETGAAHAPGPRWPSEAAPAPTPDSA